MGRYYPPSYYEFFKLEPEKHERRYAHEAAYLQELTSLPSEKRLLDVGCANGAFPRYMRNLGWQVEGVEPSQTSDPISDFPVYRQEFDRIPVDEPRYNAVTAWAVLEHLHDPMAYFRKAGQVLQPGGYFVFLVHDFASISSRYLFVEDIPRHLYFYTKATVKRFLAAAHLKLVKTEHTDKIYRTDPRHWLRYTLYRLIGRTFEWKDFPASRQEFLRRHSLPDTLASKFLYIARNPFTCLDLSLTPLYARWQLLTKSYGTVVYVAQKPLK
jgi:SAM-dependent methyltransferase